MARGGSAANVCFPSLGEHKVLKVVFLRWRRIQGKGHFLQRELGSQKLGSFVLCKPDQAGPDLLGGTSYLRGCGCGCGEPDFHLCPS